jgi:hypothetical protein
MVVSSGPVQQQGVVADNPARSAGSTELVLSAPGKAASVRITTATSSVSAASVRITTATSSVSAAGQQGKVVNTKAGSSVVIPGSPNDSEAAQFVLIARREHAYDPALQALG